ncbi:MAG TPA: hypothetical protein VFQ38_16985 [Longimicrobiales bacterium]|nr:hypothetical protein [Longimicrobiales bacterium]
MSEDRFEDFLQGAARELYNPPPATPRDAMWERIRAARTEPDRGDGGAAAPPLRVEPGPARPARGLGWWTLRALPLAAMLALGIALGRLTRLQQQPAATRVAGAPAGGAAPAAGPEGPAAAGPGPTSPAASPSLAVAPGEEAPAPPSERETGRATRPAPGGPVEGAAPNPLPAGARESGEGARSRTLYRFAAVQTLNQAELLLTSFRTDAERQRAVDPQLAAWARDVLSSTRLLLDSPAAGDPKIRGLLEDLELVLAQIVQLRPGGARSEDLQLIEHALTQRDVLPRIRTVVPAGPVSAGT